MGYIRMVAMCCLVVAVLLVGRVDAAIVSVGLTAEVTYVNDWDGLLEGRVDMGDIITGSYTYTDAFDTNPLANVAEYRYTIPPSGVILNAGGFVFRSDPQNLNFLLGIHDNKDSRDYYGWGSYNNLPLSNGISVDHISWGLRDYSMTALTSVALPTIAPVLEDWESTNYLLITFGYKGYANIQATVTSVELVPEPASAVMMGIGAVLLAMRRKRR